jgi:hypothetical protein
VLFLQVAFDIRAPILYTFLTLLNLHADDHLSFLTCSILYMTVMPETRGLTLLQIRELFINREKEELDQSTCLRNIFHRVNVCKETRQK